LRLGIGVAVWDGRHLLLAIYVRDELALFINEELGPVLEVSLDQRV